MVARSDYRTDKDGEKRHKAGRQTNRHTGRQVYSILSAEEGPKFSENPEEGAFAASVGAADYDILAGLDFEVHRLERGSERYKTIKTDKHKERYRKE